MAVSTAQGWGLEGAQAATVLPPFRVCTTSAKVNLWKGKWGLMSQCYYAASFNLMDPRKEPWAPGVVDCEEHWCRGPSSSSLSASLMLGRSWEPGRKCQALGFPPALHCWLRLLQQLPISHSENSRFLNVTTPIWPQPTFTVLSLTALLLQALSFHWAWNAYSRPCLPPLLRLHVQILLILQRPIQMSYSRSLPWMRLSELRSSWSLSSLWYKYLYRCFIIMVIIYSAFAIFQAQY